MTIFDLLEKAPDMVLHIFSIQTALRAMKLSKLALLAEAKKADLDLALVLKVAFLCQWTDFHEKEHLPNRIERLRGKLISELRSERWSHAHHYVIWLVLWATRTPDDAACPREIAGYVAHDMFQVEKDDDIKHQIPEMEYLSLLYSLHTGDQG